MTVSDTKESHGQLLPLLEKKEEKNSLHFYIDS